MTQSVAALIFFLAATCSASAAESAWDVLKRFGLTGVWADDCRQPASVDHFRTIYSEDAEGLARRELDFGMRSIYATFVDGAEMMSPSMLKITIRNADPKFEKFNDKTFWIVLLREDDPQTKGAFRMRYFNSVTTEGKVGIRNGLRLGKPSPWLYNCRSSMS
ncbi:hypothetical protein [Bradyrhizobium sp. B120]|uniref:hypothetical protein n=1 Tax=Bradyrhizobium sp. B120 TaxID=3410088 RepID=UPI003B98721D